MAVTHPEFVGEPSHIHIRRPSRALRGATELETLRWLNDGEAAGPAAECCAARRSGEQTQD